MKQNRRRLIGTSVALLAACTSVPLYPPTSPPPPAPKPTMTPSPTGPAVNPMSSQLLPPHAVSTHEELRRQAAERIVAANPERCYMGPSPEVLLAIPVLEVELNSDGSVKHIRVLRQPSQALETVQMAMDAVRRAAPFGDLHHLPKPWVFTETFLFNDDHRFKPRSLD